MPTVVEQRVHGLLQHPFFVADDNVRRAQLEQILQPIIAVDNAPVQIVQVARGESSAFQRHQRAQVRRNHRQYLQGHPLRPHLGLDKTAHQLLAFRDLLAQLFALRCIELAFEFVPKLVEIDLLKQLFNGFRAHLGQETVAVLLARLAVLHLSEQLLRLERCLSFVDDDVILVVQDPFQFAGRHIEHQTKARRHGLEKPDVTDRHGQSDVSHAFTTHARQRYFDAAPVADDAPVFDSLVLAAIALPVAHRTEDALAEQATLLGLERPVVDRLGVLHLAV